MSETTKELSPERRRFLQEIGTVLLNDSEGLSMDSDGVIFGSAGRWIPVEDQAPLDGLFAAMRMVGLNPAEFKFQQYDVIAANPFHGGRVDLKFPAQLAIKGDRYQGLHQVDLALRNPFVTATEIKSYGKW